MKDNAKVEGGRRRYTDEERAAVLSDAETLGVSKAARKHGVPQPTVSGWRRRAKAAIASCRKIRPRCFEMDHLATASETGVHRMWITADGRWN